MKCKEATALMSDYVDERLPDRSRRILEAHVDVCERCAKELRHVRALLDGLGSLCGRTAPFDCWEQVRLRIPASPGREPFWARWFARHAMAVPALAAAAIAALFLTWPGSVEQSDRHRRYLPEPEYARYITAHSHLQTQQAFTDPDVTLVAAELETANLNAGGESRNP